MKSIPLDHVQLKAVRELHNGAILCGGVGVGKSRVALRYYVEKESPKDVYIITTAKKRDSFDWQQEATDQGIGITRDATFHGVVTVDSWNNLAKYEGVKDAFFIFDEQRVVGSGSWVKSFYRVTKTNHWILLSATPGDTWLDYVPVFVANGLYKNRTEFLREHVVFSHFSNYPKVERFIAVGRLVRHRNHLLVEMPYERHTRRIIKPIVVDHDEELFRKVTKDRWHIYESRPLRDASELYSVMRKVVNTDASRLEAVRSLTTIHPKLIVFYNFDYELEILRKLSEECQTMAPTTKKTSTTADVGMTSDLPEPINQSDKCSPFGIPTTDSSSTTGSTKVGGTLAHTSSELRESCSATSVPIAEWNGHTSPTELASAGLKDATDNSQNVSIAEWNGHKHQSIPQTDRWIYLVQYTAGAEGWNCVETDAVIFFSLNYSYRIFEQCQGRIDRRNTPFTDLKYYVFRSKSYIDSAIWKVLEKKENFNEKKDLQNLGKKL